MAGQSIELTAADGHRFAAYDAKPAGAARGGLVILQEIYGVTPHIRDICDRFAARGYHATAPALYDRIARDTVFDYADNTGTPREYRNKVPFEQVLTDVAATMAHLSKQTPAVGAVGFCWGGTAAWLSAARLPGLKASVAYYPTHLTGMVDEEPRCPVLIHLGETDHLTPLSMAGALRARHGAVLEIQIYPAGHGFNCDDRSDFHAPSSALALERTLTFLERNLK